MLKTNSRQVKEKVRAFISQIFDASNYDREDLNSAPIEEKIKFKAHMLARVRARSQKKSFKLSRDVYFLV